jgi:hypothetical protein
MQEKGCFGAFFDLKKGKKLVPKISENFWKKKFQIQKKDRISKSKNANLNIKI